MPRRSNALWNTRLGVAGVAVKAHDDPWFGDLQKATGLKLGREHRVKIEDALFWFRSGLQAIANAPLAEDVRAQLKRISKGASEPARSLQNEAERAAWRAVRALMIDPNRTSGVLDAKAAGKIIWAESKPQQANSRIVVEPGRPQTRDIYRSLAAKLANIYKSATGEDPHLPTYPETPRPPGTQPGQPHGPYFDLVKATISAALVDEVGAAEAKKMMPSDLALREVIRPILSAKRIPTKSSR